MFATRKFATAARIMHSSNVDELMEAFAEPSRPARKEVPAPVVQAIEPAVHPRSVTPTAGNASGAIAAEVTYKPVGKAA